MRHRGDVRSALCATLMISIIAAPLAARADLLRDLSYRSNRLVDLDRNKFEESRGIELGDASPGVGSILGSFVLDADLTLTSSFDDNILLTETNTTSDIILETSPAISLSSDWENHGVSISAQFDNHSYLDNGEEDYNEWATGLGGMLDISESLIFYAYTQADERYTNRLTLVDTLQDARIKVGEVNYEGEIRYDDEGLPYKGRMRFSQRFIDFEPTAFVDADRYDRTETQLDMKAGYRFTPDLTLFVEPSFTDVAYDQSGTSTTTRDAFIYKFLTGVEVQREKLWRTNIGVGVTHFDRDAVGEKDRTTSVLVGNVLWSPLPHFSANLSFFRQLLLADTLGANGLIQTGVTLQLRHLYSDTLLLTFQTGFNNVDYEGITREDNNMYAGIGAEYSLIPRATLYPSYTYITRDSNLPGYSFDNNLLQLSVGFEL